MVEFAVWAVLRRFTCNININILATYWGPATPTRAAASGARLWHRVYWKQKPTSSLAGQLQVPSRAKAKAKAKAFDPIRSDPIGSKDQSNEPKVNFGSPIGQLALATGEMDRVLSCPSEGRNANG